MQVIEITIGGGKVEIETSGFEGEECLKATQAYKRSLGGRSDDQPKPEYYQGQGGASGQQMEAK